ncbi:MULTISPECIES: RadC family protein [Providencia]|uniref:DNA repair protein n=1 Tax=Providencia heimbachae ATCC 35613 TaxID=1354272 RepID=A0A1B7JU86_9GAMM|nr:MULTISPECIES: DNA repair protein RadC [Providencia]MBP6124153.1 DNA repair protein RadC [Providencia sp.]NIH24486.1 DNA repair protein RadC [Providencia heimbachae]OAT51460.1 DNA repair protein [Providencia heimbachae ATCC 35613]SQH15900.1 DNA repair protein RadC [Providencia heimbachae]
MNNYLDLPPREKILAYGAASLSDAELLAIFLRTGSQGEPVLQLAERLLSEFGSLYLLIQADYAKLMQCRGMGDCKFTQLQAVSELARRFFSEQFLHEEVISEPDLLKTRLLELFAGQEREVFMVLFLNSQHQIICHEEMFKGTLNKVEVHPREIIRFAIKMNASAIILAHNHPSGNPEPSVADRQVTERIQHACSIMGIKLLDHFVVGHKKCVSFAERGWL